MPVGQVSWRLRVTALVLLLGLHPRAVLAQSDPYLWLRTQGVDRILVADSSMRPTLGEGVVWITDPAEVERLLAPVAATEQDAYRCGYDRVFYFFADGEVVSDHGLNTMCGTSQVHVHDPGRVPGTPYAYDYAGDLKARWQPYVDRMTTSTTGWWDLKVVFPRTVDVQAAKTALAEAGLEEVELPDDSRARVPWARVILETEANDCRDALDFQQCEAEAKRALTQALEGVLEAVCVGGHCTVIELSSNIGFDGGSGYARVVFASNDDLAAFERSEIDLEFREVHPAPREFFLRTLVTERPTSESMTRLAERIAGAVRVEGGDLRKPANSPPQ